LVGRGGWGGEIEGVGRAKVIGSRGGEKGRRRGKEYLRRNKKRKRQWRGRSSSAVEFQGAWGNSRKKKNPHHIKHGRCSQERKTGKEG